MTDEIAELRQAATLLGSVVTDLRVAVEVLKATVATAADRDREDRLQVATHETRISILERWRSRVNGQLNLISFLAGGTAVALGAAILRHFVP